ncbi:PREDICTED: WAT1-related protein At4g01430 [Camelina sativa]|uniref:WAT1-related protein n=1 Tax=Camelina sativa TaxID=90675 RepID=A0ABM0T930_CAMSA|nr:PREDICTED: WAT1-related protein At4g01430 [Camelina sativa]
MKEEQWAPVIVMLISSVAMGSVNALVKKALDVGVNHMIFGAYRMAISALILVPFSCVWERKTRPKLTFMLLCEHFISGLLGASLMQFFFLLGLSYTSATVSMALVSMLPAITFALALVFRIENTQNLKSKAGVLKVMGTLICTMGAMFLTFYKGPEISNHHSHPGVLQKNKNTLHNNGHDQTKNWFLGCLYLIIGTVLLSLWMLFQGKLSLKYPGNKYSSTCLMSVFAAFQCAILSLYKSREVEDWIIEDKFVIFIILYAGIVGQAMSTVVTSWSIKMTGAVFVSTFAPVSLVAATLFDFLILRSPLYLGSILGSVVTITGLYVFLWGKKSEIDQSVSKTLTTSSENIESEDHMITNDKDTKLPV